jgi:hypothetical protein
MQPTTTLPPQLAALAARGTDPLSPVTVRLSRGDLAELEALRDRLKTTRAALLRYVLTRGLAATTAELEPSSSQPRDRAAELAKVHERMERERPGCTEVRHEDDTAAELAWLGAL